LAGDCWSGDFETFQFYASDLISMAACPTHYQIVGFALV